MFHKAFHVKSNSSIKGSDRKRWRSLLEATYPSLTPKDIDTFLPSKGDVMISKILTHSGTTVNVIIYERNPVLFEIDNCVFPTVYTAWRFPDMLPMFTTWPPVFAKLNNGADLMLPGVVTGRRDGCISIDNHVRSTGRLAKGDPCAINLVDNRAPVAIGRAALSSEDMYLSGMRGKGVIVLHTYTDQLWAIGDKQAPPSHGPAFAAETTDANLSKEANKCDDNSADLNESVKEACGDLVNVSTDASVEETRSTLSLDSMDELLQYCLLRALKTTAKDAEYPLLASTFFKVHLLPCVPHGRTLEVKKTSFKKLSNYLKTIQEKGYLVSKELTKGVESIVSVDFSHPDIRRFAVDDNDIEEVSCKQKALDGSAALNYQPPNIEELFLVSAAVLPLFRLYGHVKSSELSASDVRQILTKYVKDNSLQQQSDVVMDPILTDILLKKEEFNVISHLKWDEIQSRCLKKMSPGYRVTFPNRDAVVHKGCVTPIEISVAQRAANKKVTLVNNLEVFGIDPHELAHKVQVGVAASTSVSPAANRKDGFQVLIQGNQVAYLAKILLDEYKLPRKYISGLQLAKASKPKSRK